VIRSSARPASTFGFTGILRFANDVPAEFTSSFTHEHAGLDAIEALYAAAGDVRSRSGRS
jgi:hypothetical protein